jgi:DNA-binding CsgD family transcriptional regulator
MDASGEYIAQNLSARQRDVFELIVRGLSNKEIARGLNLAEGTVKIHVAALLRKLGVHRRGAVAVAAGVISLPAAGVPAVLLPVGRERVRGQLDMEICRANALHSRLQTKGRCPATPRVPFAPD